MLQSNPNVLGKSALILLRGWFFVLILLVTFQNINAQNNALKFDGVSYSVISFPGTFLSNIDSHTPFTFQTSIYTPVGCCNQVIFSKKNTAAPHNGIEIGLFEGKPYLSMVSNTVTGDYLYAQLDGSLSGGDYLLTIVYDGTGQSTGVKFFINGSQVFNNTSNTTLVSSINTDGYPVYIGARRTDFSPEKLYVGKLDDIRIFDIALSALDVQSNFERNILSTLPGLVAYYDFNLGLPEGTNTGIKTVPPVFSNAPDGTLSGFALTGTGSNFITSPFNFSGSFAYLSPTIIGFTAPSVVCTDTPFEVSVNAVASGTRFIWFINGSSVTGYNTPNFTSSGISTLSTYQVAVVNVEGVTAFSDVLTVNTNCNNALNFDGVNDYITHSYTSGFPSGNEDFTLEFTLYLNNFLSGNRWIGWFGAPSANQNFSFGYDGDNGGRIRIHRLDAPNDILTNVSLPAFTFSKISFVYKGVNNQMEIFINGIWVETVNFTTSANLPASGIFQLGTFNSDPAYATNMIIDDVRMILGAANAAAIYSRNSCDFFGSIPGLAMSVNFNRGIGDANNQYITQIPDANLNGRSFTLSGFALDGYTSNFTANTIVYGTPCISLISALYSVTGNGFFITNGSTVTGISDNTDFGTRTISETVVKNFSLQNGSSPLDIIGIYISGDGFEVGTFNPTTLSGNATLVIPVSFTGIALCESIGRLYIITNSAELTEYIVPLRGYIDYDNFTVTGTQAICQGQTAVISVSGAQIIDARGDLFPVAYSLYTDDHDLLAGPITVSGMGPFTITFTGLISTKSVYVKADLAYIGVSCTKTLTGMPLIMVNPNPTISGIVSENPVCQGSTVTFTGMGATIYSWSSGIVNGVPFVVTTDGVYTLTGTNALGCSSNITLVLTVNSPPPLKIKPSSSTLVCQGNQARLEAENATSYTWSGGITNAVDFIPTISGIFNYVVTGTGANGCAATAFTVLTVLSVPVLTSLPAPGARYGANYTFVFTTTPGLTYTVSGMPIPLGLFVDNGTILGIPGTVTGVASLFSITGSNGACEASQSYSILVNKTNLFVQPIDTGIYFRQHVPSTFRTSIAGIVFSDAVSIHFFTSASSTSGVGIYPILVTVTGPKLNNYNITLGNAVVSILGLHPLTIAANNFVKQYGVTLPGFTAQLQGLLPGDVITPTFSTIANATSKVGDYAIYPIPQGPHLYKYNPVTVAGLLRVIPLQLRISATDQIWFVGQPFPTLTGVVNSAINGIVPGDSVFIRYTVDLTSGADTTQPGLFNLLPEVSGGSVLSNYSFIMFAGTLRKVNGLTIIGFNTSRQYASANPSYTGTILGLKGLDVATVTYFTNTAIDTPVGDYPINFTATYDAAKYYLVSVPGTLSIVPRPLTIIGGNFNRLENTPNPPLSGNIFGVLPWDLDIVGIYTTNAILSSPPGNYEVFPTASGLSLRNYTIVTVAGRLTVGAAQGALLVRANSYSKKYGEDIPNLEGVVSGLLAGDNVRFTYLTNANKFSPVGLYPIHVLVSGIDVGKYTITTIAGVLTITQADLIVESSSLSRPYGTNNPVFTGTVTGAVPGDLLVYNFISDATHLSAVGQYGIIPKVTGSALSNYVLTTIAGLLTVTKVDLTVTGAYLTRKYGVANPILAYNISGFVNNESIAVIDTLPVGLTETNEVSNVGTYTVNFSGAADNNYSFTYIPGTLNIIKSDQLITVSSVNARVRTGESILLSASASSGLPLSFSVSDSTVARISSNVLSGLNDGTCMITCSQAGNDNFEAAAPVYVFVTATSTGVVSSTLLKLAGKDTLLAGFDAVYSFVEKEGLSYQFTYTGAKIQLLPSSARNQFRILATQETENGYVIGQVRDTDGNILKIDSIAVHIIKYSASDLASNPELADRIVAAQLAQQLVDLECKPVVTKCDDAYILNFNLGLKLRNTSTCAESGYGDFTTIGKVDSLIMGSAYKLRVSSVNKISTASFFAIWIDYGNDGSFDDPDDFISASFSPDSIFEVKNVVIRNNDSYIGPRRVRVSMRTSGEFTRSQSCPQEGTVGETEDYLVYIRKQDALQAPGLITPNGDGLNDLFVLRGVNPKFENKLIVTDRWGVVQFEKSNYENDWDGKSNTGKQLPDGTYFYFFTNGPDFVRGFVELKTK